MGMGEEMDETYVEHSPPQTPLVSEDLHWFTQKFAREFPAEVGSSYESMARYWFQTGMARHADQISHRTKVLQTQVAEVIAILNKVSEG